MPDEKTIWAFKEELTQKGRATSYYLPAYNYYNYSLTQQIYTAAEIGEAGAILSIDFFKSSTTAMEKDLNIYMVSTTKDEFESTTDFIPVTASDLVYSGTVTFADNAWTTIELDAPFVYDGTSNVAIMVDNNTGAGAFVSSTPFYVFTSGKNQALGINSDGIDFDPFAPAFSYRTILKNRVRLNMGEPPACPKPTGLTATTSGTTATLSWNGYQENHSLYYRPAGEVLAEIDFEDSDMGGWTTIDADGDGYDWVLGSACDGIYLNGGSLAGTGHNASQDLVTSGSYSNISGVLTPDNYLVSPQIALGGTISFYATAQNTNWNAEHFGVAVSTSGNTDASDFTTIQEWTYGAAKAQDEWVKYTVDLSAYAGQTGYVAIRHFGCSDEFLLDVDDIVITAPAEAEWVTVTTNEPTATLTGLDPETEYLWYVEGINADCAGDLVSETATLITGEQAPQVITLAAGTNWVSFYVETTLDDLKAALVEAAPGTTIRIYGQNNYTTYNGARWLGNLTWDLSKMYKIQVTTNCEITLEGMPINPADHPVTTVNGNNYLGFPFNQTMTLTDAFAGFAVDGDRIYSQTGYATYTRGRWQGTTLTELQPGKGYIYKSAASGSVPFVFPNSAR